MRLHESPFLRMKNGEKIREYRVNDEKRQQIRKGDVIEFRKYPEENETILMEVKEIEHYNTLEEAITAHFETDFQSRYSSISDVVKSFQKFYTPEEIKKYGIVVYQVEKKRITHQNATVCYLKKDNQVLMLKFSKKWGHVYAPPGGKFESGESPIDCILREYKEETGLTLHNVKLQGISYWKDSVEGIIFVYICEEFEGTLTESKEGKLEWIDMEELTNLEQFEQNKLFTPYLFCKEIFEGKFLLDNQCRVLQYEMREQ